MHAGFLSDQQLTYRQVGTASLTGMMLEDSGGSANADPLEWVQRQEVDELKVRCHHKQIHRLAVKCEPCKAAALISLKLC